MSATETPTTPATLLDAVNILLRAIRISPVMTLLEADMNADASGAKSALDDASRSMQAEGWEFNTSHDTVLDPNMAGEVELPSDTIKVVSARYKGFYERLTQRGLRLYDPKKRTFTLNKSATVTLVQALPFSDLPFVAKDYVIAVAARQFCLPKLPTEASFQYTMEYLRSARIKLEQLETDAIDLPLTDTSPHFRGFKRGKKRVL